MNDVQTAIVSAMTTPGRELSQKYNQIGSRHERFVYMPFIDMRRSYSSSDTQSTATARRSQYFASDMAFPFGEPGPRPGFSA